MVTDKTNQQIKLKDGRMLGYAEYGAPEGKPVFHFHGYPHSRLEWLAFDAGGALATELTAPNRIYFSPKIQLCKGGALASSIFVQGE